MSHSVAAILVVVVIMGCSEIPLDESSPLVIATAPGSSATDVAIGLPVSADFSEAMDELTITEETFTLSQGATPVSGTVSYTDDTAVFVPAGELRVITEYTATVGASIADLAGNTLEADHTWSFVTAPRDYLAWSDLGLNYTAASGDAYYPSVIFDADGFGGSSTYAMWYTDGSGAAYRVTSADGASWSAAATMTGLGGDVHHLQVLYDADRFGEGVLGPKYRIWYWDTDAVLYDISSIATAGSADGLAWTGDTSLTQDPAAQLVTGAGTGWNRGSYGPVHLSYQPGAANTGSDPWNHSYVMYYDGTDGSAEVTGLAYSSDGLYWKAIAGNPVLPASAPPAWDSQDAVFGTIYVDAVGFHYWYSGGVSVPSEGIGYAYSSDGTSWTKHDVPVFQTSGAPAYRASRTYTPSVVDDGTGTLRMYYTAQGATGPKSIGLAVSL